MKIIITISIILFTSFMNQLFGQPDYKYEVKKFSYNEEFEIAYVDEGEKTNPVLLLVHGLGGYIKHWYPIIDELQSDYRCIAIDLPGYGMSTVSPVPTQNTLTFFAESIKKLVEVENLTDVNLVGHSMGGQISVLIASKNPTWLRSLILAAPAGFETFSAEEAAKILAFSTKEAFMNQNEQQIRNAYAVNFVDQPAWVEEMIQDRLAAAEESSFPAYCQVREAAVKGMLSQPVKKELMKIKVPTLILFGKKDLLIPNRLLHPDMTTDGVANQGKAIPNATIKLIPEAGHMLQVDQPNTFTNSMTNFLRNLKM